MWLGASFGVTAVAFAFTWLWGALMASADQRWLPTLAFESYVKQTAVLQLKGDRRDVERRISDLEIQAKFESDPIKKAILEERIEQARKELESVAEDLEEAQ